MDEYHDKSYGGGALKVGMLCCLCLETLLYSFTITTKTNGSVHKDTSVHRREGKPNHPPQITFILRLHYAQRFRLNSDFDDRRR